MSSDYSWEERFPHLKPIESVPSLSNVYGIGFNLYFGRDHDEETGTYVKTRYFTLLFIPLFATGAYRVADAPGGGWYFIGKEPLSASAKAWSMTAALAILAGAVGGWWAYHVSTPEYKAGQQMARADQLLQNKQVGEAAKIYCQVAQIDPRTKHTQPAVEKLGQLLQGDSETPLTVTADVYRVVASWHGRPPELENLYATAKALVVQRGSGDPAGALALLAAVEPLKPSEDEHAQLQQPHLEKLLQEDPNNVELLSKLAVVLEARNQLDKCKDLLLPHEKKLGTSEGARILGQILARDKNEIDRADALLMPYVKAHLERVGAAFSNWSAAYKRIEQGAFAKVKNKTAPADVIQRLENAAGNEQEQYRIFAEYVRSLLKGNPEILKAELELQKSNRLIDAVLTLGVHQTFRAQSLPPAKKKLELEKAERTFLSIKTVADQRGDYNLFLGRVYYWMGKEQQGQQLIDDLLKKTRRASPVVLEVSRFFRNVGAYSKARALLEEAYGAEKDDAMKKRIAHARAVLPKDVDDELLWIKRTDLQSNVGIKALLHSAQATKALQEGDETKAEREIRSAIEIYNRLPGEFAFYHNSALCYVQLFRITGDVSALDEARKKTEKALSLQRDNTITLNSLAQSLLAQGARETTADRIDYRVLKRPGGPGLLVYLYNEDKDRAALVKKLNANERVRSAIEHFDKLTVLAPQNTGPFLQLTQLCVQRRDVDRLRQLLAKIQSSEQDLTDYRKEALKAFTGEEDQKSLRELDVATKLVRKQLEAARKLRSKATFAILASQWIGVELGRAWLGRGVDVDGLVKLAEEAHRDSPSYQARSALVNVLLYRAHLALLKQSPSYKASYEQVRRSLGHSSLIAIALASDEATRKLAMDHADVQSACKLIKQEVEQFPEHPSPWDWAMLVPTHPETAKRVADALAASEINKLARAIQRRLRDVDGTVAVTEYWFQKSQGNEAKGKEILRQFAKRGVPLPESLLKGD